METFLEIKLKKKKNEKKKGKKSSAEERKLSENTLGKLVCVYGKRSRCVQSD